MRSIILPLFTVFYFLSHAQMTDNQKRSHRFTISTNMMGHLNPHFPAVSIATEWLFHPQLSILGEVGMIYKNGLLGKDKYSDQEGFRINLEPRFYFGDMSPFYISTTYNYLNGTLNFRYYYDKPIESVNGITGSTIEETDTSLFVRKMHHALLFKCGFQKVFEKSGFVIDLSVGLGVRGVYTEVKGIPEEKHLRTHSKRSISDIDLGDGWRKLPDVKLALRVGYRF